MSQATGRLQGRSAFITGAGAGIARVASSLFAREGAKVAVIEINEETGAATAQAVRDQGGEAIFIPTDITSEESVKNAVTKAVAQLGRLDVLFNCAGGSSLDDGLVTEVDIEKVWQHTMSLDLLGTMLCARHVIPEIIKAGGGTVINMSSGAALRGGSPLHVYTSAKGAILSLTRAMAGAYVQNNVRVNAICAGRIQTERNVLKYGVGGKGGGSIVDRQDAKGRVNDYPFWLGEPVDIANIALFLASDESRMITGAVIPADGGRSAY
ncbi:MAG TPA: SDR family oxidoreductase [Burkholderiales bacterium]|nr:SDR family oxidoreductase [Burkholderiales bacterium]